uniref:Uncharacterized protein n=1 Tax=Craspedostauros australis TaxID=1486917 RepID=A0A7R9WSP2_9STRA|mmetsp:Transcript_18997/g.52778  ORF Transcript_18997/g.52778 Transcript_18997/m.52778 type:complete len:222 (+) Transcript_18997:122-787(+)
MNLPWPSRALLLAQKNLTSQTASTAASRELLKAAEARRMEAYSARVARGNQAPAKRSKTGKSSPAKYRCSICGMIKEGHICPGKIVNPVDVRAPVAGGGVTSNAPADDDEEFLQACEEIATATTDGSFSKMTNPFATNTGDGADHSGMAALGQKPFKAEAGEVIDPNDVDDDDDDDSEEEMLLLPYDCRGFPKDDGNNDDDYDHGSGGNAPSASGMFVLHA